MENKATGDGKDGREEQDLAGKSRCASQIEDGGIKGAEGNKKIERRV